MTASRHQGARGGVAEVTAVTGARPSETAGEGCPGTGRVSRRWPAERGGTRSPYRFRTGPLSAAYGWHPRRRQGERSWAASPFVPATAGDPPVELGGHAGVPADQRGERL